MDLYMAVTKRQKLVHGHLAWMMSAAFVLSLVDSLTYEMFFVASLVGFLVVVQWTTPFRITPPWRRRLRWVTLLGLLVFGVILVGRVVQIIPEGVI